MRAGFGEASVEGYDRELTSTDARRAPVELCSSLRRESAALTLHFACRRIARDR